MRWIAALFALAAAGLAVVVPASGQMRMPSISCSIADNNIALDLYLPLAADGSGAGGRSGMQGVLEIHHFKMAKDRRRWPLDGRQPAQIWNIGNDLKLRLMLGTGEALVDLIIEVQQRAGTIGHMGNFRLDTAEGVRVTGRVECQVG